jgi:hypothetical protein
MNADKLQNHMIVLQERHDALDKLITEHYNQYMDDSKLKEEKLKKLELLNEIERCKHQLENLI